MRVLYSYISHLLKVFEEKYNSTNVDYDNGLALYVLI